MDELHSSIGTLAYTRTKDGGYSLRVLADPEIMRFYRSLIPKSRHYKPQMYPAHISVVRKEIPPRLDLWGKYEGECVEFFYSPVIHFGTTYCWLNCFCVRLEEVRLELGLPVDSPYTRPPDGFEKCFHLSLGNDKK